ncbi:MAG TPA: hypothetical protein VFQ67_08955 [Allosphingosinicella sp.]|jgi:hypothetical protein|nr:hypothetical protein [Allosphingosinicella sp.]
MKLDPRLGLAAAALLLAGVGGAAVAHPHPDGDGEKTVKRFVIIEPGKGGEHAEGDRIRKVEIIGDGEHLADGDGPRVRRFEMLGRELADCVGGDKVVDESAEEEGKKTKVIICTRGEGPTAASAERIEKALARIRDSDELSDEQKARIETALRSAMERARSAR